MDLFVCNGTHCWTTVDQASSRLPLSNIRPCFAPRLSLYKCTCARLLQDCCGLGGSAQFPHYCDGLLLDNFHGYTAGWAEPELPSNRGTAVRSCNISWALRGFQCKLEKSHASQSAAPPPARPPAGGGKRARSRICFLKSA